MPDKLSYGLPLCSKTLEESLDTRVFQVPTVMVQKMRRHRLTMGAGYTASEGSPAHYSSRGYWQA